MEHKIKNEYKKEAIRLASMCLANNIPFEIAEYWDGFLIGYPSLGQDRVSDAVCHSGSYGREQGLLADSRAGQGGPGRRRNDRLYLRAVRHGSHRQRRGRAEYAFPDGSDQQS